MSDAITLIQAVVRDQLHSFMTAEFGIVTKVYSHEAASDKNNYECDVKLRDSDLELKRVPASTQRIGSVAIPNKDDMVLVQFLHGDIHSPVIVGRLYNDMDRPPEAKPHEFVYISPDDAESGIRRIYLEFPNGNKLLLDDDKLVLEMGKSNLIINNSGDMKLQVNGNLELNATGDIKLDGANISIKGKNTSLEADTSATLKGTSVNLEANASATLKGLSVKIAGMTDFSIS